MPEEDIEQKRGIEHPEARPRPSRRMRLTAFLLLCLAALLLLKAADQYLELGMFKTPLELRLGAAARAVIADKASKASATIHVTSPDGTPMEVSAGPMLNRLAAIRMLNGLEGERAQCQGIVNGIIATRGRQRPEDVRPAELSQAVRLQQEALEKIEEYLALDSHRAALVLASLKWPWLGDDPDALTADDLDRSPEGGLASRPAAFQSMSRRTWSDILARAEELRPWQVAEDELADTYKLSTKQMRALQAYLCRRDCRLAFESAEDFLQAQTTLERLIALAPVQVETVLAMRGAQELTSNGTAGLPPTTNLLEQHPLLATTLLRAGLQRLGVEERAQSAAANLYGSSPEQAESILRALGPFGIEAIQAQARLTGRPLGPEAAVLLRELEAAWPSKKAGMDALGIDPKLWRRWYKCARTVLEPA